MRLCPAAISIAGLAACGRVAAQSESLGLPANASTTAPSWPSLLLWAGGVLVVLWGASRLLPTLKARQASRAPSMEREPSPQPEELRILARDLEELADRLAERLDAKAERLEQLLRRADERFASLPEESPPTYAHVAPRSARRSPASPPRIVAESTTDPATERIYALADTGVAARDIAHQLDEPIGKVQLILALRG